MGVVEGGGPSGSVVGVGLSARRLEAVFTPPDNETTNKYNLPSMAWILFAVLSLQNWRYIFALLVLLFCCTIKESVFHRFVTLPLGRHVTTLLLAESLVIVVIASLVVANHQLVELGE